MPQIALHPFIFSTPNTISSSMHFTEQVLRSCFYVILGYIRQFFKRAILPATQVMKFCTCKIRMFIELPLDQRLTKLILKTFLHKIYMYSEDKTISYAIENLKKLLHAYRLKRAGNPYPSWFRLGKTPFDLIQNCV